MREMRLGGKQPHSKQQPNNIRCTLENDLVFARVLQNQQILLPLLREFFQSDVKLLSTAVPQYTISNINEHGVDSIRCDIKVEATGEIASIELQRSQIKGFPQRTRIYGSYLDTEFGGRHGPHKYTSVRDNYVIVLQKGGCKPFSHFTMKDADGEELHDGKHVIIVNYEQMRNPYFPAVSEMCRLLTGEQSSTRFGVLVTEELERVSHDQKFMEVAMTIGEKIALEREAALEEGMEKGIERGIERGRAQERERSIKCLAKKLKISEKEAAEYLAAP